MHSVIARIFGSIIVTEDSSPAGGPPFVKAINVSVLEHIAVRPPTELIRLYTGGDTLPEGSSMFCGTLAVHGGIQPAEAFEIELEDPVLGRKISHRYAIDKLPDEG